MASGNALEAILHQVGKEPGILIREACIGPYWMAISSRRCGLASAPHIGHDRPAEFRALQRAQLVGQVAAEVAQWVFSTDPELAAAGMAAINSLIEPDMARCQEVNARDILLEKGRNRRVAMIGHFPFTEELRAAAGQLWVLELHPRPGDLPADRAIDIIPQADVVAVTAVTLINHTFDHLIALCRPDAYVVLLGGSAPLSPALFDFGVDVIGGTIVDDPNLIMEDIARGATFRQLRGKRPLLMFRDI